MQGDRQCANTRSLCSLGVVVQEQGWRLEQVNKWVLSCTAKAFCEHSASCAGQQDKLLPLAKGQGKGTALEPSAPA